MEVEPPERDGWIRCDGRIAFHVYDTRAGGARRFDGAKAWEATAANR